MLICLKWFSLVTLAILMGFSIYFLVYNLKYDKSKGLTAAMIFFIVMSLLLSGLTIYVGWFM